jgi:hypothetical protein
VGNGAAIYIGKAIPRGGRKGGITEDSAAKGFALRDRLGQHSTSIQQAINLDIEHFFFQALVVDDIWIPLGENMLIELYKPAWNRIIDGFGNKDPGKRRKDQYRSSWDVIHPGRKFAEKLAENPGPLTKSFEICSNTSQREKSLNAQGPLRRRLWLKVWTNRTPQTMRAVMRPKLHRPSTNPTTSGCITEKR